MPTPAELRTQLETDLTTLLDAYDTEIARLRTESQANAEKAAEFDLLTTNLRSQIDARSPTVQVQASPNPVRVGEPVQFTATVGYGNRPEQVRVGQHLKRPEPFMIPVNLTGPTGKKAVYQVKVPAEAWDQVKPD